MSNEIEKIISDFSSVQSFKDFLTVIEQNPDELKKLITPAVLQWVSPKMYDNPRIPPSWYMAQEILQSGHAPGLEDTPLTEIDKIVLGSYRAGAAKDQVDSHSMPIDHRALPNMEGDVMSYKGIRYPAQSSAWDDII